MENDLLAFFRASPDSAVSDWLEGLFSADGGQVLNNLLQLFNTILFSAAVLYFIWQVGIQVVTAAAKGRVGDQAAQYWGTLRSVIGLFLLFPVQNGLSIAQTGIISLALAGSNFGQAMWDLTTNAFLDEQVAYISTSKTKVLPKATAALIEDQFCMIYYRVGEDQEASSKYPLLLPANLPLNVYNATQRRKFPKSGGGFFGEVFSEEINKELCGIVSYPNYKKYYQNTPVEIRNMVESYQSVSFSNIGNLELDLFAFTADFALLTHPSTSPQTNPTNTAGVINPQITNALSKFEAAQNNTNEEFLGSLNGYARRLILDDTKGDWTKAGVIYKFLVELNSATYRALNDQLVVEQPRWGRVFPSNPDHLMISRKLLADEIKLADSRLELENSSAFTQLPQNLDVSTTEASQADLAASIRQFVRDATDELFINRKANQSTLTRVGNLGDRMVNSGAIITLGVGVVGSVPFVGQGVIAISSLLSGLTTPLFFIGTLLNTVLPALPFIFFGMGLISWIITIVSMFVMTPFVLIRQINFQSAAPLIGQIWPNFLIILFRPAIMIIALVLSIELFDLIVGIFDVSFGQGFDLNVNNSGSVISDLIRGILYVMANGIIYFIIGLFVFRLIVQLPDKIHEIMAKGA